MKLVNFIYWLQTFIAPVIILGLTGIFIGNKSVLIVLLITGVITGIILAEYIREKIGLEEFYGRLYNSGNPHEKTEHTDD